MRKLHKSIIIICSILAIAFLIVTCHPQKSSFTQNDLRWLQPFETDDTVIYQSSNKLTDTIIFFSAESTKSTTSGFEQGFYTTYSKSVRYKLTNSSYHIFTQVDGRDSTAYLFTIDRDTNAPGAGMELYFLGLLFNNNFLDSLTNAKATQITFNESNAAYRNLNIVEGIKSFNFDFKKGITSFIDNNNIKWIRK